MLPDDPQETVVRFLDKGKTVLKNAGKRLLVHTLSIIGSLALAGSNWSGLGEADSFGASVKAFFVCYIGLICLFPGRSEKPSEWSIPVGLGLSFCAVSLFLGLPIQNAIFLGGLLVWSQRMFYARWRRGWDWLASPFLLIALWRGFLKDGEGEALAFVAAAFLLAAAGAGVQNVWSQVRRAPSFRRRFGASIQSIREYRDAHNLPEALTVALERLQAQGALLLGRKIRVTESDLILSEDMALLAAKLKRLPDVARLECDDAFARSVILAVGDMTRRLDARLAQENSGKDSQTDEKRKNARRLDVFRQDARRLADGAENLPPDMKRSLENIRLSAASILDCMEKDERDLAPGERFLTRYIALVRTIVDNYPVGVDPDMSQNRSRELLLRLEKAFADQHKRFLDNDLLSFNVEMNVLDKLLKMDGY
ncbi:hypothetical protein FACS1894205_6450 [Alphaproteobacteria bacterium]|nr:hypothetical protein FACS1894205_6450 [Alphaproteobacteria bacterium]